MRIGLQHEHAVELGVLLDFGAVDEEAVALRVGEETAVAFVADEALVALLQLPLQGGDDCRSRRRYGGTGSEGDLRRGLTNQEYVAALPTRP